MIKAHSRLPGPSKLETQSMIRSLIERIVRRLYRFTTVLDNLIGPGKYLDSSMDTVLILGGSSNIFGIEVIKVLIFEEGIDVVNLDTVDHSDLIFSDTKQGKGPCSLEKRSNEVRGSRGGTYYFIKCQSITDKSDILKGLKKVYKGSYGISVFVNNVNEGLFEFMQGSTNPLLSHGPLDLKSKSFVLGNQAHFQDLLNSNLINVMISVKFFLNEIVPQTIEMFSSFKRSPGFYIINTTNTVSLCAPAFAGYYAASKAGLNQFHESLTSELGYYNNRRIKTLLIFLPFLGTHTINDIPWTEYASLLVRGLKQGKTGNMTLSLVPGKFSFKQILSMSYPTKYWRAYEPTWCEKLFVAISRGYPHVTNYIWPQKGILGYLTSRSKITN